MRIPKELKFTRYQWVVLVPVYLCSYMFFMPNLLFPVFANVAPKWRCISQQDNTTSASFSHDCQILQNCSEAIDGYIEYENSFLSLAQELGYLCDQQYLSNALGTIQTIGLALGALVNGQLGDHLGRRLVIIWSVTGTVACSMISTFLSDFVALAAARVATMFFAGGVLVLAMVMTLETVDAHHRMSVAAFFWFAGGARVFYALATYATRDWRNSLRIMNLSGVISLLVAIFMMKESPSWLEQRGRNEEAKRIKSWIRKFNGDAEQDLKEPLHQDNSVMQIQIETTQGGTPAVTEKTKRFRRALPSPSILKITAMTSYFYFTASLASTSLDFTQCSLPGDFLTVQIFIGALSQCLKPAVFIADTAFKRFSRPLLHQLSLGAVLLLLQSVIALMVTNQHGNHNSAITAVSIAGRVIMEYQWDAVLLFANELFPTACRSTGSAVATTVGRLGDVLGPVVAFLWVYWQPLPYLIVSLVGIFSIVLSCFFAPNTKGISLT